MCKALRVLSAVGGPTATPSAGIEKKDDLGKCKGYATQIPQLARARSEIFNNGYNTSHGALLELPSLKCHTYRHIACMSS